MGGRKGSERRRKEGVEGRKEGEGEGGKRIGRGKEREGMIRERG